MAVTFTYEDCARMLRRAVACIEVEHEMLSRLDAATGDGDHGTTIRRAMSLVEKAVNTAPAGNLTALLEAAGNEIMGSDGGSTGPLFGQFFLGLAEGAGGAATLDAPGVARAFEAGLAKLRLLTRAKPGDKTLVDALVPAIEALKVAAAEQPDVGVAMARAAAAAEAGAASTKTMRARFGRAKNLGDRSIGSADPGATSASLIIRSFAQALA